MPLRAPLGESEDPLAEAWRTPLGESEAVVAALRMPLGESEDAVAGAWRTPFGESGAAAPAALRMPLGESDAAAAGLWRTSFGEPDAGLAGGLFLMAADAATAATAAAGVGGAFATPLRSVPVVLVDFGALTAGARGAVPAARTAGAAELTGERLGGALVGVGLAP